MSHRIRSDCDVCKRRHHSDSAVDSCVSCGSREITVVKKYGERHDSTCQDCGWQTRRTWFRMRDGCDCGGTLVPDYVLHNLPEPSVVPPKEFLWWDDQYLSPDSETAQGRTGGDRHMLAERVVGGISKRFPYWGELAQICVDSFREERKRAQHK